MKFKAKKITQRRGGVDLYAIYHVKGIRDTVTNEI